MSIRVQCSLRPLLCGVGLLLASCGESDESRRSASARLGGVSVGAPLASPRADKGILADQTTYQPTPLPGLGPGGAGDGKEGGAASVEKDVRVAVLDLVKALEDSELELALRSFESAHVSALTNDDLSVIFTTLESFDTLRRTAADKLGPAAGQQVIRTMTNLGDAKPRIQTLDASHAGVTPNVALALLGPRHAGQTLAFALVDGVWKAQLDQPLAADTTPEIIQYHQTLQATLHKLSESVLGGGVSDARQLVELLKRAMQGEAIEVPAAAAGPPAGEATGSGESTPDEKADANDNAGQNDNENDNGR